MRSPFSNLGMYCVPMAQIDESQVYGSGGHVAPVLHLQVLLDGRYGAIQPNEGIRFVRMSGRLFITPHGQEVIVSRFATVNLLVRWDLAASTEHRVYLEFPLNGAMVCALEKLRDGGDLRLKLKLEMETERLRALETIPQQGFLPQHVWGLVEHLNQSLESELVFSQKAWTERVLAQIGHGRVHLIELPAVPVEETADIAHSFEALKQAQRDHREGRFDDAVGKCRVALEPFFESVEIPADGGKTRRVPQLKTSWQTKLGAATYTWLNSALIGIKDATNKPHHSPNRHYDQFESQMIQAITTTLIAYAARNPEPTN
ncbi:hypothetical protein [Congregicoccus parvus]|uniref:hypothetical protein n=1 Tax=Congregicoccus parvus TaxID=3081749 RepID=UPI003FA6095D